MSAKVTPDEFSTKLSVIVEELNNIAEENDIDWCLFSTTYDHDDEKDEDGKIAAHQAVIVNCSRMQLMHSMKSFVELLAKES